MDSYWALTTGNSARGRVMVDVKVPKIATAHSMVSCLAGLMGSYWADLKEK
jgi:hypothetical protein